MSDAPRVEHDEATGALRVGGRPLAFDARTGSVTLELETGRVAVRPLAWWTKRSLSRWARLGEGFMRRQLLSACVDGALPEDRGAQAELWAVVAWLNAPGLGFDSSLLSQVTLEVCRSAALMPADLDQREAWDVESLWQAARRDGSKAKPEPEREVDDGVRRIVVVPDPTPRSAAQAVSPLERAGARGFRLNASAPNTSAPNASAPETSVGAEQAGASSVAPSAPGVDMPQNAPAPAPSLHGPNETSPPVERRATPVEPSSRPQIRRFRILPVSARGAARPAAASARSASVRGVPQPAIALFEAYAAGPETEPGALVGTPSSFAGEPARELESVARPPRRTPRAAAAEPSTANAPPMPREPSTPPRSSASHAPAHESLPGAASLPATMAAVPTPARVDHEALFEELGERFDRAAADLGIDVEV
jgi:hypothetical protein